MAQDIAVLAGVSRGGSVTLGTDANGHHTLTCSGEPVEVAFEDIEAVSLQECCYINVYQELNDLAPVGRWILLAGASELRAESALEGARSSGEADLSFWEALAEADQNEDPCLEPGLPGDLDQAVNAQRARLRALISKMRRCGEVVGEGRLTELVGAAAEGPRQYVLHDLHRQDHETSVMTFLGMARAAWSTTMHLDLLAVPGDVAHALNQIEGFTLLGPAGENWEKVLETADFLYGESLPGDPYHDPTTVLRAAEALEERS